MRTIISYLFAILLSGQATAVIAFGEVLIGNNNIDDLPFGLEISISACSSDAIILTSSSSVDVNVSNILKPGFILTQIGDDSSNESNDPCSNECYPLLRKIASYDAVGNKFMTSFATFSDIFPKDLYHPSLSDTHIEPLFGCSHSNDDSTTVTALSVDESFPPSKQQLRRQLSDPSPDENFSVCDQILLVLVYPVLLIGCLLCPLLVAVPPCGIIFLIIFSPVLLPFLGVTELCNLVGLKPNLDVNSSRRELQSFSNTSMDDISLLFDKQNQDNNTGTVLKKSAMTLPPLVCLDWMHLGDTASSVDGSCAYVDCKIGDKRNVTNCFHCNVDNSNKIENLSTDEYSLCSITDYSFYGMINVADVVLQLQSSSNNDPIVWGIHDAFCVQDHCYSSNMFDKPTCDQSFYQALQNTCNSLGKSGELQQVVQFPLKTSVFENSCHLLSFLIYLGAKKFGGDIYQKRQINQLKHNQKPICKQQQGNTIDFGDLRF